MKKIFCDISAGELIDKISILEIKKKKIKDQIKLRHVNKEYKTLINIKKKIIKPNIEIRKLSMKLKKVNLKLWAIEDKIRKCEKNQDFGKYFIKLARKVYFTNDDRSRIKLKINNLLGSDIIEVKNYSKYN